MSEIKPVLSPEEWANEGVDVFDGYVSLDDGVVDTRFGGPAGARNVERERLALAALLLNGLPGGFTWEDVDDLREVAETARSYAAEKSRGHGDGFGATVWIDTAMAHADRVDGIADRIAALLPPREGEG